MAVRDLTTTRPTLLLDANPKRKKVLIQMQTLNNDANNTERIHIGTGFQPVASVGHGQQGDILRQADGIEEPQGGGKITPRWKGPIWATSSKNNQSITFEEVLEEEVKKEEV